MRSSWDQPMDLCLRIFPCLDDPGAFSISNPYFYTLFGYREKKAHAVVDLVLNFFLTYFSVFSVCFIRFCMLNGECYARLNSEFHFSEKLYAVTLFIP